MTVEATIALPEELLRAIDERSNAYGGRSQLIEVALRAFLRRPSPKDLDARDLAIIEKHLDELNAEAEDALDYQVAL